MRNGIVYNVGILLGCVALILIQARQASAEFIPQLELSGSLRRLDYQSADTDQLGVASTLQPSIRPSWMWGTEGGDPWRYRFFTSIELGKYNLPSTKVLDDGGVFLFGAGNAVDKQFGRARIGLGFQYEQKKALGRDSFRSVFLSTVGIPGAFLDLAFIGIGTSTKTLWIGVTGFYYLSSSHIPHDDLQLLNGKGISIYWNYEFGEDVGWALQSAYTIREFDLAGGTLANNDFTFGIKIFVPHSDITKLPIDY